jgi:hypothetical protein
LVESRACDDPADVAISTPLVVLLYQRWIYRVDYSRANEYGQVMETPDMDPHEGTAGKAVADVPGVQKSKVEVGQNQKAKKSKKMQ